MIKTKEEAIKVAKMYEFQPPEEMDEILSGKFKKGLIKGEEDFWFHVADFVAQVNKDEHGKRLAFAIANDDGYDVASIRRDLVQIEDINEYLKVYDQLLESTSTKLSLETLSVGIIIHPCWVRSFLMVDEGDILSTLVGRAFDTRNLGILPYEVISRSIKALESLTLNME